MKYVSEGRIEDAKKALDRGDILAVPTEAAYGLAVRLDNIAAIRKLLKLKNHKINSGKALTIMVASVDDIKKYALVNRKTMNFARHYFPGELTLILPKHRNFRHQYFDHFETVGIRIPDHEYLLKLLRMAGPLLVTSANQRDEAPCRNSKEVAERLSAVDTIIEGESGGNLPSTVIDWTKDNPVPMRQGGLLIVRYS